MSLKFTKRMLAAGLLAALLAGALPAGSHPAHKAQAASTSQLKSRLAELKSARAEANAAVEALEGESEKYSEKIAALDYQIQSTRAELNATQKIIDSLTRDIADKQEELDETTAELDDKQALFETRIRVMYENGDTTYLEVLLSSEDFSDMLTNMEIVSQIMDYDKRIVEEYKALKAQIETQKADLEQAYEEIEAQKKEYKALKAKVDSDLALKKAEAERMLREQDEINDEIAALSRQETAASGGGGGKVYSGSLVWPCPSYSRISSQYGYRTHPISGTRKLHKGLDIAASSGNPVIAAASGTVVKSYFSSSYGNYVVISHGGGLMTAYAHMTRRLVSAGQTVAAGQQVGTVGSTGNSTGPHLHFEVYVGGSTTNPMNYFS